ncbi:MAG: hypothetical protein JSS29_04990 [Proteobacteria bacterium]|nr:hypothetical protein [Pseudomonadota bacterium]
MSRLLNWQQVHAVSRRVNWSLEDLVGETCRLDFSRPFLPESLVRARPLKFLSERERLLLNHVRTRGYLALFELVESFVVPFMAEQVQAQPGDAGRASALRNFIREEEKHRKLFTEVLRHFDAEFATRCEFIGPAQAIRHEVLRHSPIAVTIATLGLEWMSQGHYVESVREDHELDPAFKSLLRHHWIEEAQHAELDALLLSSLASQVPAPQIDAALEEYFEIGAFLDDGLKQLTTFDLEALQAAAGRRFSDAEREEFLQVQCRAQQWTFIGCAMGNRNFQHALALISEAAARRVAQAAITFSVH